MESMLPTLSDEAIRGLLLAAHRARMPIAKFILRNVAGSMPMSQAEALVEHLLRAQEKALGERSADDPPEPGSAASASPRPTR